MKACRHRQTVSESSRNTTGLRTEKLHVQVDTHTLTLLSLNIEHPIIQRVLFAICFFLCICSNIFFIFTDLKQFGGLVCFSRVATQQCSNNASFFLLGRRGRYRGWFPSRAAKLLAADVTLHVLWLFSLPRSNGNMYQ